MDLSHVMSIDFIQKVAGIEVHKIALFNKNRISEDEVRKFLAYDSDGYNPEVIVMNLKQFNHIFLDKED